MGNPPRTTTPAGRTAPQTAALGVKSRSLLDRAFPRLSPNPTADPVGTQ